MIDIAIFVFHYPLLALLGWMALCGLVLISVGTLLIYLGTLSYWD